MDVIDNNAPNPVETAIWRWWQSITPNEVKKSQVLALPSSYRAELKRCDSPDSAMMTSGFRSLWFSLPDSIKNDGREQTMECWSVIAILLTHVKNATSETIAFAAGRTGDGNKPIVSELRFARLQQAKSADELLRRARRILQQLKGEVSPTLLADDILNWFKQQYEYSLHKESRRIAVKWAIDYYRAASNK